MAETHGYSLMTFSPRVRERLLALASSFHFEEGSIIFHEGDPALNLYIVRTGKVSVEMNVPPQGTQVLLTAGPREFFSWSALIEPRIETATCRALEPTDVLGIRGGVLMDACREDPMLGFELYRCIAEVVHNRLLATRLQVIEMTCVS